ncbi:sulfotransferase [Novosphingobium sp. ST904]|uniref:sulfotransferase family protein n=1 Tax=Novosphingobium sp. ST904 TaxID=1684385 RepID=UPI0006C8845B|nr:sulfotransferase [Novosphingobium sp. ST904]KPH61498.1 sulfotransferase [Novosphingobium sp. ST904]TCM42466.1 sulfotransferase family protein [Novosphingobium sp. ST904]
MTLAETIINSARELSGNVEWDEAEIREPLRILAQAVQGEAALTPMGLAVFTRNAAEYLANRMRVEDWIARHPEILDKPVEKPTFVFGLPRTGTTLTINLLNEDTARRCFLRWEAFASVPPPKPEEFHAGPRYDAAQAQLDHSLKMVPHIAAIHHEDADSPCECQFSMAPSFVSQVFDSQYHIPSYHRWFLDKADYLPAFRYQKRLLQLLQSQAPGRWTLKNPWHPLYLDALHEVYPDARLVMTHRDPVEVVGSACSLVWNVRRMFSDSVDREAIGRDMVETFELMIARQSAFRQRHGHDAIHDILYTEQIRDPLGTMRCLYARFGDDFSAEAEANMQRYLEAKPKDRFGKHTYDLADYGLVAGEIRERFADYCVNFGLAMDRG